MNLTFKAACCLNIWLVRLLVSFVCQKKFYDTSKQGRRLSFGMLTVLTNIRSTKVLWLVEDDLQGKTSFDRSLR